MFNYKNALLPAAVGFLGGLLGSTCMERFHESETVTKKHIALEDKLQKLEEKMNGALSVIKEKSVSANNKAKEKFDHAEENVKGLTDKAKDKIDHVKDKAKEKYDQAKEGAGLLKDKAKESAGTLSDKTKEKYDQAKNHEEYPKAK